MCFNGVVTLTTGSWTVILVVTMVTVKRSNLTSTHSERVRLLVAWSQERESYMSILTVWIKGLCGLDYQHTHHSGVWLMFLDVLKRYN